MGTLLVSGVAMWLALVERIRTELFALLPGQTQALVPVRGLFFSSFFCDQVGVKTECL